MAQHRRENDVNTLETDTKEYSVAVDGQPVDVIKTPEGTFIVYPTHTIEPTRTINPTEPIPTPAPTHLTWPTNQINPTLIPDPNNVLDLFELAHKRDEVSMWFIKNLIQNGVNPDIRDENGMTPLMHAVEGRIAFTDDELAISPEAAATLISEGADVNAVDNAGRSVLMYTSDTKVAQMLIEAGADVNAKDNSGMSVLRNAATQHKYPYHITSKLLEKGANPSEQNKQGQTTLMQLLENGGPIGEANDMYVKTIAVLAIQDYSELKQRDPEAYMKQMEALQKWILRNPQEHGQAIQNEQLRRVITQTFAHSNEQDNQSGNNTLRACAQVYQDMPGGTIPTQGRGNEGNC